MIPRPPQPRVPSSRSTLGGISLLLLVAMALQAAPGFTERADSVNNRHGPVVRMIAEAVTWRSDRSVRRQEVRPAPAQAHPAVTADRSAPGSLAAPDLGVVPTPLAAWLLNLPPPALA
jgi:hypothetical protein